MPKISVLINTRNRPEALDRCLKSVFQQNYSDFETIVLDDYSTNPMEGISSSWVHDRRIRWHRSDRHLGVAAGRNYLMKNAKSDLFCFLDDDACFTDQNCLETIVRLFGQHPQIGILSFKIIDHSDGEDQKVIGPFSRYWLYKRPDLTDNVQLVSYYLGTCHAIRRSLIRECGAYQDDFFFGEEELDLSYRAIQAGSQILYAPDVVAHHYPEISAVNAPEKNYKTELYYHARNRLKLAYQYLPYPYILFYLGIWISRLGCSAIRQLRVKDFFHGLSAGFKELAGTARAVMTKEAMAYLRKNYGRIWY